MGSSTSLAVPGSRQDHKLCASLLPRRHGIALPKRFVTLVIPLSAETHALSHITNDPDGGTVVVNRQGSTLSKGIEGDLSCLALGHV
jgi:hypothetical protein